MHLAGARSLIFSRNKNLQSDYAYIQACLFIILQSHWIPANIIHCLLYLVFPIFKATGLSGSHKYSLIWITYCIKHLGQLVYQRIM